jgi:DNA topoisomerase-1
VVDTVPGIRRRRAGRGFAYRGPDGRPVTDPGVLERIRSLAVPPAWRDVWIAPTANAHLQATGRDARGRKQYRYHRRWREVRDEDKYERTMAFAEALPKIRRRVQKDLARQGLPREKVLAAVIRLLETTFVRVGNEEYARDNRSYGLTTLRDQHARFDGPDLSFSFVGKSGVRQKVPVADRRLASIVRRCQEIPGQRLFQYLDDDGEPQTIDSSDVNGYLQAVTGQEFTAKDFRTWAGTVLAAQALRAMEAVDSDVLAKKNVVRAIESVASSLGNTPAVCRRCYVHPAVIESYVDGSMLTAMADRATDRLVASLDSLRPEEAAVLALLQQRLRQAARRRSGKAA